LDAQLRISASSIRRAGPHDAARAAAVLRKEKRRFLRRKLLTYLARILFGSGSSRRRASGRPKRIFAVLYACILLWAVFFLDLSVNFFRYRKALRRRFAEASAFFQNKKPGASSIRAFLFFSPIYETLSPDMPRRGERSPGTGTPFKK
jgi:hypothetical protein